MNLIGEKDYRKHRNYDSSNAFLNKNNNCTNKNDNYTNKSYNCINENDDYVDENNYCTNEEDYYDTEYTETNNDADMPYIRRTFLLTKREQTLYRILKEQTANTNLNIHCKTRLEDLMTVAETSPNKFADWNRIKSKHVDFTITDDESRILFCIELDDNTHDWENTKEKDLFKDRLFKETHIPLFRIKVGDDYRTEIKKILEFFIWSASGLSTPCFPGETSRGGDYLWAVRNAKRKKISKMLKTREIFGASSLKVADRGEKIAFLSFNFVKL